MQHKFVSSESVSHKYCIAQVGSLLRFSQGRNQSDLLPRLLSLGTGKESISRTHEIEQNPTPCHWRTKSSFLAAWWQGVTLSASPGYTHSLSHIPSIFKQVTFIASFSCSNLSDFCPQLGYCFAFKYSCSYIGPTWIIHGNLIILKSIGY